MTYSDMAQMTSTEQEKHLSDASVAVKNEAFNMKRCLDGGQLMDALKHASQMLSELRTSALSPKFYYRLFMEVTDELKQLESHLIDEFQAGRRVSDLYELVQYAGHIIPRLYLLITVGSVYIRSGESSRSIVLKDLVEMTKGVQHPLRGLFLRNYLLMTVKDLLPTEVEANTSGDGVLTDSIDFILLNFSEMNKLWVRMQHQGSSRDREKRERERLELRILVGTNLVRLANLDKIDTATYKESVLPGVLEQVVSCRDPIAQEYLMDCVIQVFPDEAHIATLDVFLGACAQLHQSVQMKNVVIGLIERLASYSEGKSAAPLFDVFSEQVTLIVNSRVDMPAEDVLALQTSLVNLALKCYPEHTEYPDLVFASTNDVFAKMSLCNVVYSSSVGRELLKLMRLPLEHYPSVLTVLSMGHYAGLMSPLDARGKAIACMNVVNVALEQGTTLPDMASVDRLFALLSPLVTAQPGEKEDLLTTVDVEDFAEEQNALGRLVNLIHCDDVTKEVEMVLSVRTRLYTGGRHRTLYTLPSIVIAIFKLIRRAGDAQDSTIMQELCKVANKTINKLASEAGDVDTALRLLLQGALLIDTLPETFKSKETIAYAFIEEALCMFEEDVSDSRAQLAALTLIVGTLQRMRSFTEESHEPLRVQCAKAAQKLFKKPDKCKGMCTVAHLLWSGRVAGVDGELRDGEAVDSALKRAIKTAVQCMDPCLQVQLFTDVLDEYIYFGEQGCVQVTTTRLNELMSKIRETLPQLDDSSETDNVRAHFQSTLKHLKKLANNPDNQGSHIEYGQLII